MPGQEHEGDRRLGECLKTWLSRREISAFFVGTAGCGAARLGGVGTGSDDKLFIASCYPIMRLSRNLYT